MEVKNTGSRADVCIPHGLYTSTELSWREKILLCEIKRLSTASGCTENNAYFAQFLRMHPGNASIAIGKLVKLKLVERAGFDGRKRTLKCLYEEVGF